MKKDTIEYKEGFNYQLYKDYSIKIDVKSYDVETQFIKLIPNGTLTVKMGYAWDGASGPTIDTLNSMRGSLIHDVLYQLMREGLIPLDYRKYADKLLKTICMEDGMSSIRATIWFWAVDAFASKAASSETKIYVAPTGEVHN